MMKRVEGAQGAQAKKPRAKGSFIAALLALCLLGGYYTAQTRTVQVVAAKRELPVYCVERADNIIAISFDAAWGGDKTMAILDILDEYEVKTTFFLVDIWTQRFPELVKEIVARGHELGNHSTSHPQMSKLSRAKMAQELKVMSDNVETLTGTRPTLFRPPYGDYNNDVVTVARAEGYEVVQWSVDSLDWKNRGVQDLITQSTKRIASGDIVLFHNDSQYIVEALPAILKDYQSKGFTIVPISQILLEGETTIDTQGRQKPVPTKVPEV